MRIDYRCRLTGNTGPWSLRERVLMRGNPHILDFFLGLFSRLKFREVQSKLEIAAMLGYGAE